MIVEDFTRFDSIHSEYTVFFLSRLFEREKWIVGTRQRRRQRNHRRRCIVFKKYATISRYFPPTRVTFSIYLAFTPKPDVSWDWKTVEQGNLRRETILHTVLTYRNVLKKHFSTIKNVAKAVSISYSQYPSFVVSKRLFVSLDINLTDKETDEKKTSM